MGGRMLARLEAGESGRCELVEMMRKGGMSIEEDAEVFGRHTRHGGWLLGFLLTRCSEKKPAGRPAIGTAVPISAKASVREFADLAGVSHTTALRYFDAWEEAAAAGEVPYASTLCPTTEQEDLPKGLPEDKTQPSGRKWADYRKKAKIAAAGPSSAGPSSTVTVPVAMKPEDRARSLWRSMLMEHGAEVHGDRVSIFDGDDWWWVADERVEPEWLGPDGDDDDGDDSDAELEEPEPPL